jgi:hypothetical protein
MSSLLIRLMILAALIQVTPGARNTTVRKRSRRFSDSFNSTGSNIRRNPGSPISIVISGYERILVPDRERYLPDQARRKRLRRDFRARCFGTRLYQKITQKLIQATDLDETEVGNEGTQREAHQFRACADLFKTHPTGMGSVLIAHGEETPHGASSVFRVRFPRLVDHRTKLTSPATFPSA